MFKKSLLLCLAGVAGSTIVFADEADTVDEQIIVYGVRLDQAATEVGSSVSILTAEDIETLGTDYVLDAVATLPGVTINQNGAFGGAATVRIRGASSEQTLVIIDGVDDPVPIDPSPVSETITQVAVAVGVAGQIEPLSGPPFTEMRRGE